MNRLFRMLFICLGLFFVLSCAGKPDVTTESPSVVVFQFTSDYNNTSMLSFWRKIEVGGEKGPRFSIGVSQAKLFMNSSFPKYAPVTMKLDPGTYYLDSFEVPVSGKVNCLSEKKHFKSRNGWDDAAQQPLFLSFTVEEGQHLILPQVVFSGCTASFTDEENIFTVGRALERK